MNAKGKIEITVAAPVESAMTLERHAVVKSTRMIVLLNRPQISAFHPRGASYHLRWFSSHSMQGASPNMETATLLHTFLYIFSEKD